MRDFLLLFLPPPRSSVKAVRPASGGELYITMEFVPCRAAAWLGEVPYEVTYKGSCTVWNDVATGRRPGTRMESRLCDAAWLYTERLRGGA